MSIKKAHSADLAYQTSGIFMKWKTGQPILHKPMLMSQSRNIFKSRNFFVGEFDLIGDMLVFRHRNGIVSRDLERFEYLDPNEDLSQ